MLLSASDADVTKIGLLSNALQCYSFRLLPVTKASQTLNHRSGDEKALVTISDPDPRACVGESQFRDGYESGSIRFEGIGGRAIQNRPSRRSCAPFWVQVRGVVARAHHGLESAPNKREE